MLEVGKITTAGMLTGYSAGINGEVDGMTAGPDGNLWLPLRGSGSTGSIARFSTKSEKSHGRAHKRRGHKRRKKHH